MKNNLVCAVIVTYFPDINQLNDLLASLISQVQMVLIVDNSANQNINDWLNQQTHFEEKVIVKPTSKNLGLGAAHNLGIDYAKQHGFDFVLQFDQDSIPEHDMVKNLINAYQTLISEGHKVAAVGPNWIAKIGKSRAIFTQHNGFQAKKLQCSSTKSDAVIATDYLITSGCLIPVKVFDDIGYLNESLFIDFIDIEWGLRATSKGYKCFGVCAAILTHELGDKIIKVLWRNIHYHSPIRHYYTFRNLILLLKQNYIPFAWKVNIGFRYLIRLFIYPLIFKPRIEHLKMIFLGILHGLRGLSGEYSDSIKKD